jgi:hypothetical protein
VNTLIDPVTEVSRVIGKFRRQLRRSTGRGFDSARLTESQSELLWLVGRKPDISVSAAAAELGLVANTAGSASCGWPRPPNRSSTNRARPGGQRSPMWWANLTTTKSIL